MENIPFYAAEVILLPFQQFQPQGHFVRAGLTDCRRLALSAGADRDPFAGDLIIGVVPDPIADGSHQPDSQHDEQMLTLHAGSRRK
ncbi:hypothetical protein B5V00_02300 [Geothermobacter hydrogeniphilus]|uniref:Uncharacterized protein n=1 Tax=Geothermobacter hydrogeniphilus TaxID=1969733 RepID=A0A1X0YCT6_9BACT|nr:hypothetical protein B5V00_02300 [Geothermobacter hydrogeniphilus]